MSRRRKRVIRPKSIPLHLFAASGTQDWRGVETCQCGSAWDASVHAVPQTHPDAAEIDARRMGEASEVEGD